jgi:hypothetical protein
MTNKQIIIGISIWLISSYARLIFNRVIEKYIPKREILISYIKKIFILIVGYALPIAFVIYLMIARISVDKYFVLIMAFSFFSVAINFSVYMQNATHKSFRKVDDLITRLGNLGSAQWESMTDQLKFISTIVDFQKTQDEKIKTIEKEMESLKNEKKKR